MCFAKMTECIAVFQKQVLLLLVAKVACVGTTIVLVDGSLARLGNTQESTPLLALFAFRETSVHSFAATFTAQDRPDAVHVLRANRQSLSKTFRVH